MATTSSAEAAGPKERGSGSRTLALLLFDLGGGGAQRRTVRLANEFAERGHCVDLLVFHAEGPLKGAANGVRFVKLKSSLSLMRSDGKRRRGHVLLAGIYSLARYLRLNRPQLLMASALHLAPAAVLARALSGSETRVVLRCENHYSRSWDHRASPWRAPERALALYLYRQADALVAVSQSVASDMSAVTGIPPGRVATIYNPIWSRELAEQARQAPAHAWFAEQGGPPIVLAAGRLTAQKDFPTLIRAFAKLRRQRELRLLILGEGKSSAQRTELLGLAGALGVGLDVALPGFDPNPLASMARASLFVLPSRWEGLPGVLIEAMACGCPVVSTDCPGGSREILEDGRWGPLVSPGDPDALAQAMADALDTPLKPEDLRRRAAFFQVERAVEEYLALFEEVLAPTLARAAPPSTS